MRIEHQAQLVACGQFADRLRQVLLEDRVNVFRRRGRLAFARQATDPQVDQVRPHGIECCRAQARVTALRNGWRIAAAGSAPYAAAGLSGFLFVMRQFGIAALAGIVEGTRQRADSLGDEAVGFIGEGLRLGRAARGTGLNFLTDEFDLGQDVGIHQRTAGARLGRHGVVKAQRAGRQVKARLDQRHDPQRGVFLRAAERIASRVEVADHLEHEWAESLVAVVPGGTGRRQVPVAAQPHQAVGVDGEVLGDVAPAVDLRVVAPHRDDGVVAAKVGVPGPPSVVHVHRVDLAGEGKLLEKLLELVRRQALEGGCRHGAPL